MKQGFVFDLDGTLVDSLPGIATGLNRALESLGLQGHSEQAIRRMVGKGARELCKAALAPSFGDQADLVPDGSIHSLLEAFMREYPHTWQGGTIPYPGIPELLVELQDRGIPLAVLSNKPHVVTEPLVKQIFPDIRFDIIMGYSEQFPRKPDPSALLHIIHSWQMQPTDVTMIGDSVHDAKTATGAGTKLVLVGWGYSERHALDQYKVPVCESTGQLKSALSDN